MNESAFVSRILGKNVNTVYTLLNCSKQMLRETLGDDTIAALLSDNEIMMITVIGSDGQQSAKILSGVEACTEKVQGMTMREIRELLERFSVNTETDTSIYNKWGNGHHGHGGGRGNRWRNGEK